MHYLWSKCWDQAGSSMYHKTFGNMTYPKILYEFYSRSSSTTRANGFLRSNQSSASPPPILTGSRFGNTSGIIGNNQERDQSLLRSHLNSVHDKSNLTSLNASTNTNHANTTRDLNTTKKVLNASALVPANVSKFMLLSKEAGVRVTITSLGQFPIWKWCTTVLFIYNSHFLFKKEFPLLLNKKWEFKWEL